MDINLRHIRAFAEVARYGGFSRAAEALGISQPSLTIIINQFEEELGFRLLDRTTRRVWVPHEGAAFLPVAERFIENFDSAIEDLRIAGAGRRGRVNIAAVPSAAVHLLPRALRAFSEKHPSVSVRVSDANSIVIQQQVLRHDIDFGIASVSQNSGEFELTPLVEDRFGLVCRFDHPFASSSEELTWAELQGYPFIGLTADTGIYPLLEKVQDLPESARHPLYIVANMSAFGGILQAGLRITALPELAVPHTLPELVFRPLKAPVVTRTIGLLRRRGRTLTPAAESFRKVICEMYPGTP